MPKNGNKYRIISILAPLLYNYFNKTEKTLLISSTLLIIISFLLFDRNNYLSLFASLIGISSLLLSAKGNPFGQLLMVIFSLMYGIISFTFAYYGEMITYLGMTLPMSVFSSISWIRHPYNKNEVKINRINKIEILLMFLLSLIVTYIFYLILKYLNTNHLFFSMVSITTSFLAVYLSFRRSTYFTLAYACNDLVLIVLWILASIENIQYISVVICFIVFFFNDLYGFVNWKRIERRQNI